MVIEPELVDPEAEKTPGRFEEIEARAGLAGSNRFEILLFSLGTSETFGINVFKVREGMATPIITRAPNGPPRGEWLVSRRGNVNPVVS
ncbi:MAG: chemotaxis protein CheW, partial [Tepidiphilus sp.]